MPKLGKEKLSLISRIIEKWHLVTLAQLFGFDAVSEDEKRKHTELTSAPTRDAIEEAYKFGKITADAPIEERFELSPLTFRAQEPAVTLPPDAEETVELLRREAEAQMRATSAQVSSQVVRAVLDEEHASRDEADFSSGRLNRRLKEILDKAHERFSDMTASALHDAVQHAHAEHFEEIDGEDALVAKIPMPDACARCRELYLGPDGAPRIYRLADLAVDNTGRKRADWVPTVGITHPSCSCVLVRIPEGWGFDANNNLIPNGPRGHRTALRKSFPVQREINFQGIPISIEHEAGDVRPWRAKDGRIGKTVMKVPYGYVRGTLGSDGDEYDVFVGPDESAPFVFVVHQQKEDANEWDEDKALVGFADAHSAKETYLAHYTDPSFFGSMSMMTVEEFREKLKATTRADSDGMVKSCPVDDRKVAIVPPLRKLVIRPGTLRLKKAAGSLSPHAAAFTSQTGNRAVHTGVSGPNILFQSPAPPTPIPSAGAREALETYVEKRAEEAVAAKPQAKKIAEMKLSVKRTTVVDATEMLRPVELPEQYVQVHQEARDDAEENKKTFERRLKQRNDAMAGTPYQHVDGVVYKAKKAGLGQVFLKISPRGYEVFFKKSGGWIQFPTLSAACDHVWVNQKGYKDVDAWRQATGKRKVPSGAGQKFWGMSTS